MLFVFNTEIQDDHQKWRGNHFWQKIPDDSAYTLGLKNLLKSLSCTVSEINAFLCLTQKFKMATKNEEQTIFGKKCQNHTILHHF